MQRGRLSSFTASYNITMSIARERKVIAMNVDKDRLRVNSFFVEVLLSNIKTS